MNSHIVKELVLSHALSYREIFVPTGTNRRIVVRRCHLPRGGPPVVPTRNPNNVLHPRSEVNFFKISMDVAKIVLSMYTEIVCRRYYLEGDLKTILDETRPEVMEYFSRHIPGVENAQEFLEWVQTK